MLKLVALSLFEKALWLWGISRDDGTKEKNISLFTQSLSMQELFLILQINTYGETDPLSNRESAAFETERCREAGLAASKGFVAPGKQQISSMASPIHLQWTISWPECFAALASPVGRAGLAMKLYIRILSDTFYPRTSSSLQLKALFIRCWRCGCFYLFFFVLVTFLDFDLDLKFIICVCIVP